jgi:hypothetical protein
MRTLLRHRGTGLYLQGPEKWTDNAETAYDFRFIDRAIHYVETWDLEEVELAFAFEDPECITTAPLDKAALRFAAA